MPLKSMFVIDLETDDMTMASISAQPHPQLFIWELACTPQSLKIFSRIRFRQEAYQSANRREAEGRRAGIHQRKFLPLDDFQYGSTASFGQCAAHFRSSPISRHWLPQEKVSARPG
jgi:hypothetical protein